jgi:hypothetical protein
MGATFVRKKLPYGIARVDSAALARKGAAVIAVIEHIEQTRVKNNELYLFHKARISA